MRIVFLMICAGIVGIIKGIFEYFGIVLGAIPLMILFTVAFRISDIMYKKWIERKQKKNE